MVSTAKLVFLFFHFFKVLADLSPHVTLELLLENGFETNQSSWNSNAIMPNNLVFRIRRDHEAAVLRLTKITPLETLACRENGSYRLNHTTKDESSYVDYSTKSVLLARRVSALSSRYSLRGHLQIGLRLIHIEPTKDGVHEIIRQETLGQTSKDMEEEHNRHHRYKRSLKKYTVEVCLIADYQVFFKFLERNNNDIIKAESDMRNYYAFVAETMKVRFRHINEVDGTIAFNIVISGLIIIESRQDSLYTEPFKTGDNIDVGDTLNATQFWLESPPSGIVLPPSDHYMFFTAYNLHKDGMASSLGRAYSLSVCIADSYVFRDSNVRLKGSSSIVEDNQGALTTLVAAHELGHALGALHDSNVGCNDTDRYIMATTSGPVRNETLASHPWQFSTCSVRDMKAFVERDDVDCVSDDRYGDDFTSTEPFGQYYDKDTQCKILQGEDSIFCDAFFTNDKQKICYLGHCRTETFPDGRYSCSSVMMMEYTKCDTNKWCYKGLCVNANNSAPVFLNIPTSVIKVSSDAKGVIFTAQTFDTDGDSLSLHITYDPPLVSTYISFDSITMKFSVRQGFHLADLQMSIFSLIMSVDDGLLLSLPVNVDFMIISNQPPSFNESSFNLTVSEGEAGIVIVSTLLNRVTDPDSTQFNFILLVTTNSEYFTIDSSSGRISYAKDYDYDPMRLPNNVQLLVQCQDETGLSASVDICLTILNIDQPPVFQNLPASVDLHEDTARGTVIFDVSAIDNDSTDTIVFSFVTTNNFITTYLTLNTNTGAIQLKAGSTLDYEQLITKTIQVTIRISTDQAFRDAILTITVTNNRKPSLTNLPSIISVPENTAGGKLIFQVSAQDQDGDHLTFYLQKSIPVKQNLFDVSSAGEVRVRNDALTDFENQQESVYLTITVFDGKALSTPANLTLIIVNVNEPPSFNNTINISLGDQGGLVVEKWVIWTICIVIVVVTMCVVLVLVCMKLKNLNKAKVQPNM